MGRDGWGQHWHPAQTWLPGAASSTWKRGAFVWFAQGATWMDAFSIWLSLTREHMRGCSWVWTGPWRWWGANGEFKRQSSDTDLCLKHHSDCILEGGFEDGKFLGKETSERSLVQVRNSNGLRKWWIWYLKGRRGRLDDRLALWVKEREVIRMAPRFLTSAAPWEVIASQQRLINPRTLT